jgi:DNA-binding FrmR family transcriptional regulator
VFAGGVAELLRCFRPHQQGMLFARNLSATLESGPCPEEAPMIDLEEKEKLDLRLKRIAGQVAGIQRMIEEDRYCMEILTQITAARAALAKVSKLILSSHLRTCVTDAFAIGDTRERRQKLAELVEAFERCQD